ncbi:MAG: hypothetical protein LBV17_08515 [Treponema sp.]|nr:hypothetical protein [Treponema sp.]
MATSFSQWVLPMSLGRTPNTPDTDDNDKQLYLSGQQIESAGSYFADTIISIIEQ